MTRCVRVTASRGSEPGARAAAGGHRAADQSAQVLIVLAGLASLPEELRVDGAEDRSAAGVGDSDLDLHQARGVHDDALERLVVGYERDELAFVKGPHLVERTQVSAAHAAPSARICRALRSVNGRKTIGA